MDTKRSLVYIDELMYLGQWTEAMRQYKAIGLSPRDFTEWLEYQDNNTKENFGLLGFYCRSFTPLKSDDV